LVAYSLAVNTQSTQVSRRLLPNRAHWRAFTPITMATPATALLADFDFDLTSHTQANPLVPRPPTPDPRRTPTPHPPRRSKPLFPPAEGQRRLRKKPTAIFVGSEPPGQATIHKPYPIEARPFFDASYSSHHTLPSLLPLLPSTPSPRFATSPSLSSSGTTVQSSPTLTPTSGHFTSSCNELPPTSKGLDSFSTWNYNQGKFGLRRAKRLPHREQGLWEVHAVVHVSEVSEGCGDSSRARQGKGKGKGKGRDRGICNTSTTNGARSNNDEQGFQQLHFHKSRQSATAPLPRSRSFSIGFHQIATTLHIKTRDRKGLTVSIQSLPEEKPKLWSRQAFRSPNTTFPLHPATTASA
jgi:hypothetical protein